MWAMFFIHLLLQQLIIDRPIALGETGGEGREKTQKTILGVC